MSREFWWEFKINPLQRKSIEANGDTLIDEVRKKVLAKYYSNFLANQYQTHYYIEDQNSNEELIPMRDIISVFLMKKIKDSHCEFCSTNRHVLLAYATTLSVSEFAIPDTCNSFTIPEGYFVIKTSIGKRSGENFKRKWSKTEMDDFTKIIAMINAGVRESHS